MGEKSPTAERILEAAITSIEAGGEASLRLDDVARQAGITKPSIYYFYGDREGLIAAAQAERYRRFVLNGLVEAVERTQAVRSRSEFEQLLPSYVEVAMDPAGALRRAKRIEVLGSAVSRPVLTAEVTSATKRALELTSELARIPFERGWANSSYDPDAIALWWLSTTLGRHLFDLAGDDRLHEQWRAITLKQLHHLYFDDA